MRRGILIADRTGFKQAPRMGEMRLTPTVRARQNGPLRALARHATRVHNLPSEGTASGPGPNSRRDDKVAGSGRGDLGNRSEQGAGAQRRREGPARPAPGGYAKHAAHSRSA